MARYRSFTNSETDQMHASYQEKGTIRGEAGCPDLVTENSLPEYACNVSHSMTNFKSNFIVSGAGHHFFSNG
eukprot:scaffold178625_cov18-Prasinocladus_malaysianus.AAC.1